MRVSTPSKEFPEELSRRVRRPLCCTVWVGLAAGALAAVPAGPGWTLLGVGLLALAAVTYYPLRAHSQGIDYRAGERMVLAKRDIDYGEKDRLFDGIDCTRWFLLAIIAFAIPYVWLSLHYGWWLPRTSGDVSLLMLGIIGLGITLPTVIATWSDEAEDEEPEYPFWEERD